MGNRSLAIKVSDSLPLKLAVEDPMFLLSVAEVSKIKMCPIYAYIKAQKQY